MAGVAVLFAAGHVAPAEGQDGQREGPVALFVDLSGHHFGLLVEAHLRQEDGPDSRVPIPARSGRALPTGGRSGPHPDEEPTPLA